MSSIARIQATVDRLNEESNGVSKDMGSSLTRLA